MPKKKAPRKNGNRSKTRIEIRVSDPAIAMDIRAAFRDLGFSTRRDPKTGIVRLGFPDQPVREVVRRMNAMTRKLQKAAGRKKK